jgi:carbamoyl-phosphate synthase small subunit
LKKNAILTLENGATFQGISVGFDGDTSGEVVFNTSITGYQEILTDPSYSNQIVTLTYPHIGNVGTNNDDYESQQSYASGLVIKESSMIASNYRSQMSLKDFLTKHEVPAIAGIDTRKLTMILREEGALKGSILVGEHRLVDEGLNHANNFGGIKGIDLARVVSTKKPYAWDKGESDEFFKSVRPGDLNLTVAVMDYGVKTNILRILYSLGCSIDVFPAQTDLEEVMKKSYDGIFLSNGPGDPEPCDYAIAFIKEALARRIPLFGICLGHQLLGLAAGARTMKMKFGHHGANHPVINLETNKVSITSQNHGFAIVDDNLPDNVIVTHRSLFDKSIQGIAIKDAPAYSFQGHPEASPGPHDVIEIFDNFINYMKNNNLG